MLNLSNLKPKIKKPKRVRRGRGLGSGRGAYSGRGIKGQKARTGGNIKPGFEGGRQPLIRQMPKIKGFSSPHKKSQIVDLASISKIFSDNSKITPKELVEKGLIKSEKNQVKLLGKLNSEKKYHFSGIEFSTKARQSIETVGGTVMLDKQ